MRPSSDPLKSAQFKRWYVKHREQRLAYLAEYRRNNKLRIAVLAAAGRAREIGAAGELTIEALQARIDFYGGRCWICRAPWQQVDHVIPWARGGTNWPANVRPICGPCNRRKASRDPKTMHEPSRRGHRLTRTAA